MTELKGAAKGPAAGSGITCCSGSGILGRHRNIAGVDMSFSRFLLVASSLLVFGCQGDPGPMADDAGATVQAGTEGIDTKSFRRRIKTLSSDEFEGRSPATEGGKKTIAFIRDEFKKIGLSPGNGDSWYQEVPLVAITADSRSLTLSGTRKKELEIGKDAMVWTKHVTDEVEIAVSELVFVGYGIVAPEYDWNDYEGIDVKGKTVLMFINDPGYATQDPALFNGNAMTYYGRWTYKYEEAARQGAAGVLLIHETGPAGYPFEVITGGNTGPQYDLITADKNFSRSTVEGWVNADAATDIFAAAGMSLEDARQAALQDNFSARVLPWQVSAKITNTTRESASYNVLGVLPGTDLADEYIVYMAHWDHLGRNENLEGDQVFNGAVDNASGTSALMEIAEAFRSAPTPPRRSILLLAVTAEESGLLGSRHYGTNPVYPLAKTVAGVNMDVLNVHGRTKDVSVIGFGSSELEEYLERFAGEQDRVIVPEPTPEKGFFYRSDHFNLAKQGVPVIYAKSGFDYRNGGPERGAELARDWVANRYHKVGDEYEEDWDLSGAVEDMQLYYAIGMELAQNGDWPQWYSKSEFKAIRDASLNAH